MPIVRVRYFAGAAAAAGVTEECVELTQAVSVAEVLRILRHDRGPALSRVLDACAFLLNGTAVRDHSTIIRDQDELDILPPFAGG